MQRFFKFLLKTFLILFLLLNVVVIFHAYKFTHFYEMNDAAVKKQEAKNGWDKTSDLLFGFNAAKQQNTAPDTTYKSVSLRTADGLTLSGWLINVANSKGSVAMFHGHGSKKSAILSEAKGFNRLGYNTLLVDMRAHGASEGNTCTIGYKEAADVKTAYEYLQKTGETNIVLYGISLGAATVTKAINDYALKPSKIILEMPFASLPDAVEGRVKMMGLPVQPISTLLTFWGGTLHGFWAYNLRPADYVKKIKCPVLVHWGRHDPRVSEAETNDVFKNITTPKRLEIFEESGHESLLKKEPSKWMNSVATFLQ